jgi:hypothetical protein
MKKISSFGQTKHSSPMDVEEELVAAYKEGEKEECCIRLGLYNEKL